MKLDRIIISVDDTDLYHQNLNLIYRAWKKFFPEAIYHLVYVSDNKECPFSDPYDYLTRLKAVPGIPSCNQGKMARFFVASSLCPVYDVCMVNDADLIPLQRDYYQNKLEERKPGQLLMVGADVYKNTPHKGKAPIAYMTAESNIFKKLFNPTNLRWEAFAKSFINYTPIDGKEAINKPFKKFSDESLIRALLKKRDISCRHSDRDTSGGLLSITRLNRLSIHALQQGKYIDAHHLMPRKKYKDKINAIRTVLDV